MADKSENLHTAVQVAAGFSFLEAPRWHEGALYFSDFYTHKVHKLTDDGVVTVCEVSGRPSGLGFTPDGDMLVVSMLDATIRRWNGTNLETYADISDLVRGTANDMLVDSRGIAYVGNMGDDADDADAISPTTLVRIDSAGRSKIAATDLVFPNGMVMTQDERTLIVAETFAARITAFDIGEDGELGNRRVWAQFGPSDLPLNIREASKLTPVLPDGLAIDSEAAIWVADAQGHGIARVAEGGEVLDFVDTGNLSVYAAALGGSDGRTLYLCCAPALFSSSPAVTRDAVLMLARVAVPRFDSEQ